MKEWFLEFWTNKDMFSRTIKGVLFGAGTMASMGMFGELPAGWTGAAIPGLLQVLGIVIPAGEKNTKPVTTN